MYPLTLHSIPAAYRLFASRKADEKFLKFSQRVLERDAYTCQFCGFQARKFQEVVNLDMNYQNNKLSNMVTACCFCSQCFFMEAIGKGDYGGGILIYLPEISQSALNALSHVLFCAIANATDYRMDAQNIYRSLKMRSKIVEQKLGEGMSNPSLIGQALIQASTDLKTTPNPPWLSMLRLLPARAKFSKQIEGWAKDALSEMST